MSALPVTLPELAPAMESATLVRWLKRIGDPVRAGELLIEVETDKATMEVEAPATGTLTSILIDDGTTEVPVNAQLGAITLAGQTADAEAEAARPAPTEPESIAKLLASPKQDGADDRIFVSPLARRLLAEAGLDARGINGSGPNGRIVERDVAAARAVAAPSPAAVAKPIQQPKSHFHEGRYEQTPHDTMRRSIARRLTDAKQTAPHFYLATDCRLDALLALRQQANQGRSEAEGRLSLNDFFIKALARALMQTPQANVSFGEDAMVRHRHADISVAVAVPDGLVTPVIADADSKSLLAISAEMKDLARRAQARRLTPAEYQGGTAGLSNLGMYGVSEFTAILNPPQATMLALGAAEKRVIALGDAPAVATMLTATLSADHRAVDGVAAAKLLSAFKALVETPVSMLL